MGTISDKLMRIINTKEDIRQALISKGYDVPTSIPFKEYAKMISDLPCRVDSFPDIEGIVARYSALGLTNEQMAANPVWVDKTGNGHDIQLKNFSWKGMSGVGGYVQDFNYFRNNATVDKIRIDEQGSNFIKVTILTTGIGNAIYIPKNIYQFNKSYFIKISSEGYNEGDLSLSFYAPSASTATTVKVPLNPNGITEIPAIKEDDFLAVYLNVGGKVGSITIEQLPLYPGALVFDGVDDYGTCDNFPILTKEKGFTIVAVRQFISVKTSSLLSKWVAADESGAFIFEGMTVAGTKINSAFGGYFRGLEKTILSYMTSTSYNGNTIVPGNKTDTNNNLVVGRYYSDLNLHYANAAIWEIVILDHDATEEELTKIKDYFVKTYPWLFPDQAWTVVGKTNEDEDRATIANITGNGNDLVLSNFGFAEGSGYNEEGEYAGYLVTDGVDDKIISSIFKMGNDWTVIGDWELINTGKNDNAGIVKFDSIVIYNYNYNSVLINIKNGRNILIPDQNTVNAICSDGRIYSKDWKESIYNEETESTSKNLLTIGYSGNAYTKIAFKNLAIYPTVLSREDCIKAYNYLQTLKAK
jgi:hypothetical protein